MPALPVSLWDPGTQGNTLCPHRDPVPDRAALPLLERIAVLIFQTRGQTITLVICAQQSLAFLIPGYALAGTGGLQILN